MMNYKLLTCLLCMFGLSPLRANIYEVFKLKTAKDLPASPSAETESVAIENIPDEVGNLIAQEIIKGMPLVTPATYFKSLKAQGVYPITAISWDPTSEYIAASIRNGFELFDKNTEILTPVQRFIRDNPQFKGKETQVEQSLAAGWVSTKNQHDSIDGRSGFSEDVFALWSPNGQYVAVSRGRECELFEWDEKDKKLKDHGKIEAFGKIQVIAWNPNSKNIACGINGGVIEILNINPEEQENNPIQLFTGHDAFSNIAWSPDGKFIAATTTGDTLYIWDVENEKMLYQQALEISESYLAWSRDSAYIAFQDKEAEITIFDINQQAPLAKLKGHTKMIRSISWSPNRKFLVSRSYDDTIIVWDMRIMDGIQEITKSKSTSPVLWSPDGKMFASGSENGVLKIWNAPEDLLGEKDLKYLTLEQALLLKLLYAKRPTYAHARMKPIDFNVPLHDQLPVEEAQQILSTFSNEAQNRIIKRYSPSKKENDENAEKSSPMDHRNGSAAASSSGYIADAMEID